MMTIMDQLERAVKYEREHLEECEYIANHDKVLDMDLMYRYKSLLEKHKKILFMVDEFISNRDLLQLQNYELKKKNSELFTMCSTDTLTGVLSRQFLFDAMKQVIQDSYINMKETQIIMMDIDHFKRINDNYGHQNGDRVLKLVAATVEQNLRPDDIIGRYGGEEFTIVLSDTNQETGIKVVERIRQCLKELSIPCIDDDMSVTASFGMSTYSGHGIATSEELIGEADMALVLAKKTGKDKLELHENMMAQIV